MRAAHKKTASLPCVTIQKQFPSIFSESTKASALYIIRFCNVCDDVRILMTSVYVGFVFRKLRMHRLRVWIGMETVADPISAYWMWGGERTGYSIATTIFCNVYPPSTLAKQRAAKTILPKLLFCRFVFFFPQCATIIFYNFQHIVFAKNKPILTMSCCFACLGIVFACLAIVFAILGFPER